MDVTFRHDICLQLSKRGQFTDSEALRLRPYARFPDPVHVVGS